MNKVAIVCWSGTGNTEQMAQAVAEGVKNAGGEAGRADLQNLIAQAGRLRRSCFRLPRAMKQSSWRRRI